MSNKSIEFDSTVMTEEGLKKLLDLLKTTRYGYVTLVVQDGVVIQMERNEKIRFK